MLKNLDSNNLVSRFYLSINTSYIDEFHRKLS